jgi:hypothetical protein
VKLFSTQKQPDTLWLIEVDYGSGWFVYGPLYPQRQPAERLARELRSHGHEVRVRPVDERSPPSRARAQRSAN